MKKSKQASAMALFDTISALEINIPVLKIEVLKLFGVDTESRFWRDTAKSVKFHRVEYSFWKIENDALCFLTQSKQVKWAEDIAAGYGGEKIKPIRCDELVGVLTSSTNAPDAFWILSKNGEVKK